MNQEHEFEDQLEQQQRHTGERRRHKFTRASDLKPGKTKVRWGVLLLAAGSFWVLCFFVSALLAAYRITLN